MASMIERVAKIICASGINPGSEEWENTSTDWKEEYKKVAKTIIAAIREPTENMLIAPIDMSGHEWYNVGQEEIKDES